MPARGWRQIVLRAWRRGWDENIGLVAAGTAFYGFVSLVPLLIGAVLIYSFFADPAEVIRSARSLTLLMPKEAAKAIGEQILRVVNVSHRARGAGIIGAFAVALFGARNAATALIAALNHAYGEEEKRGRRKLLLVALTITLSGFAIALAMLMGLSWIRTLRNSLPDGLGVTLAFRVAAYALTTVFAGLGAAALYRYAPCRTKARLEWTAPGSLVAALGWAALTTGFGLYVQRFGTFGANYGPSAAGVVLLVWLYLSGVVFLFGAEINAELERQTEKDTTEGGDKPIGRRGAEAADEVAESSKPEESKAPGEPDAETSGGRK